MTAVLERDTRGQEAEPVRDVRRRRSRAQTLTAQTRAFQMLEQGLSFDVIAAELGYANRSGAWKLVQRGLTVQRDQCSALHFELAEARWTALLAAWWRPAIAGDTQAAAVVSRVLASLDSLWGLTGGGRQPGEKTAHEPHGVVMTDAELAAWEAAGSPAVWHR